MFIADKEQQIVTLLHRCIGFKEEVSHEEIRPECVGPRKDDESTICNNIKEINFIQEFHSKDVFFLLIPSLRVCLINSFVR